MLLLTLVPPGPALRRVLAAAVIGVSGSPKTPGARRSNWNGRDQ